jgi:site-specific recombinase XerD
MAWRIVKGVMQEAEIKGIQATCKGLRHSYGVRSVMTGVPVTTLQTLMGHKKIETTTIYLNILGDELRQVVKASWEVLFD